MLNIVVVEDEALIAQRLIRYLNAELADHTACIRHFSSLDEADDYLSSHSIDLLFLDLNLHGQDGFDLLKTQMAASYHTIVVSANTDRAIEAFEYGVLDFVGKPFSQERIAKALARALTSGKVNTNPFTSKSLSVERQGRIELVALSDIDYIKASGHYSELVLLDGSMRLHNKSLSHILDILPNDYRQVHRSYVVSVARVKEILIHQGSQYELLLTSGSVIPLGRTYYKSIKSNLSIN